ncbi:Hypothetical predicted protein [Marmota monax]|uniref:Uncharacterized protein n=1 Tax=Marmota monax TaxID=9995 RepID=A0A5E4B071_MARMO|nr:Hypothetical predicted protein [Marmota monax]
MVRYGFRPVSIGVGDPRPWVGLYRPPSCTEIRLPLVSVHTLGARLRRCQDVDRRMGLPVSDGRRTSDLPTRGRGPENRKGASAVQRQPRGALAWATPTSCWACGPGRFAVQQSSDFTFRHRHTEHGPDWHSGSGAELSLREKASRCGPLRPAPCIQNRPRSPRLGTPCGRRAPPGWSTGTWASPACGSPAWGSEHG